jgi:hypothetical protein
LGGGINGLTGGRDVSLIKLKKGALAPNLV